MVHSKVVKMLHFMLHVFYQNKKKILRNARKTVTGEPPTITVGRELLLSCTWCLPLVPLKAALCMIPISSSIPRQG